MIRMKIRVQMWWWWCLMLDRVTSSQADPWSRAWHHKTPDCPLVKRCHNLSRVWRFTSRGERDCVTVSHKPGHCTAQRFWVYMIVCILRPRDTEQSRVIRPFVLVSPFFLWSLWPRARSQVLRMLRIYLAIRELANKHPAALLHFALLQLHRCMHVIYDVLTIIWNAGNVTRSLLISLKGMKQTSMIRYSGWHKIM